MMKLSKKTREQYMTSAINELKEEKIVEFRETFLQLHPSDQSDIFMTLQEDERHRVYVYVSPREMAVIFGLLKFHKQKEVFQELNDKYASEMLNNMFTDDIVTFLTKLNNELPNSIIDNMEPGKAEKIKSLLSYEPETAGAVMTKEFVGISSTDNVTDVLNTLRVIASDAEIIYYLYVVDEHGKLIGVVSLRNLLVANPEEMIVDIMNTRVVSVPDQMDQEDVGKLIKKYDFLAVPVVTTENHLLGIITVDDIMDILEAETTEDFGELTATKGATDINLTSFAAAKKRSPWIISLMFFGLITGGVIGRFEETLESVVLLAVFIPMIMDSAGNVGTQSLAISVRGLALGTIEKNSAFKMVRRELKTGFLIGLICMVVITGLVFIFYSNVALGLIVGFSILLTLGISAVIGAIVPLIINKLKFDPAIASGPFITTLNDIIGLLIYFSIATTLIEYL